MLELNGLVRQRSAADEAPPHAARPPSRILIVDPDPMLRSLLEFRLGQIGCESRSCASVDEAIRLIDTERPDLVILELLLEGLEGNVLLRSLRDLSHRPAVLVLSYRDTEEDVIEVLQLGASDFMRKPFVPAELLQRVKRLLEDRPAEPEVPLFRWKS